MMKCSECKEYSKEEHICNKCRQGNNSAVKFWLRHESDCIDMEIKDGDCLYYSKVEKDKVVHELKTLRKYFDAVCDGQKTFEVRKDDRNFQVGDTLKLQRYENGEYQKADCTVTITYILGRNGDEKIYVPEGYVILGIK